MESDRYLTPEGKDMVCRDCGRAVGKKHTSRCVFTRGSQRGFVASYQCIVLTMAEGREIATELVVIKARLGQLGLFKTMHALDAATTAIGYELAEKYPC